VPKCQAMRTVHASFRPASVHLDLLSTRDRPVVRLERLRRSVSARNDLESLESLTISGMKTWLGKPRRYERGQRRSLCDLIDEEWALVEPLVPPAKPGGN